MTEIEQLSEDEERAMDRIISLYRGETAKAAFHITCATIAYYLDGFEYDTDIKRVKELIIDWINSQDLDEALAEVKAKTKGRLN